MKKKVLLIILLIGVLSLAIIFRKEDNKLIKENIKSDNTKIAVNISNDGINYTDTNEIPTTGYSLNTEKSMCKVATNSIANAPKDNNITIEYTDGKINFLGVTKQSTRCYLYFDKKDEEKPVISSVTTSVTKNSITVNVSASDNEGVTEYLYSINGGTYTSKTTSSHTFTGLSSGTSYTIRVYVKDKAGNSSSVTTKSATTQQSGQTFETILAGITIKSGTPDFSQVATTDEGVYSVSDGMYGGTSYYWRGAATNNYVKFAGFCWRIIRINGDKTMRLIYDGTTCHANGTSTAESIVKTNQTYNSSLNRSEYVGWTYSTGSQRTTSGSASNVKTQTDTWYNANITGTNASKVADGKFCNDRNVQSGSSWSSQLSSEFYYAARVRLALTKAPTLECPSGDVYTLNVGAITADEVAYAGGVFASTNNSYYLYNGQFYWTMSPINWNGSSASVLSVSMSGSLVSNYLNSTNGVRPVINLKADTLFTVGGTGTQSNPYVVS